MQQLNTCKESNPLSFAQQRLWFFEQLEPNSPTYHISKGLHLQGNLKVAVLQQTLDAIVAHNEALRTNFIAQDGIPVQLINEPKSVELVVIDLRDCPETERTTQVERLLEDEVQRPFNLASDLMLRACLLQLSPQEHILLLVMHNIASDEWSISILFEQLTTLYQAFIEGKPNPLAKMSIQYADFAQWQRQWLSGEVIENQINYWKQHLPGATPVLELPTDRPRPPVQTYRGAKQSFVLPQSLCAALHTLSQQEGVTLFMTLLAAFQTLLYRYTGQQDILVGSPIPGRNLPEIEGLIGLFVNTLVLRTDISGNPSFRELLQRVRSLAMSAYAQQDLPFEKLVEELQLERSLSYHPLFQVMFVLENTSRQTLYLPGLTSTFFDLDNVTSRFDLTLSIKETEHELQGWWEYNTDLFDAATITRMIGHFQTLLDSIVANPQQQISELPLLTPAERYQLLFEWNDTQADYPQDKCIHELLEQQVERNPDTLAVVFENQQVSYQELNSRANQLAHYLRTLGVGSDVLVGICVERSIEMVVGLLGILKAGGAYVPLDPTYPKERSRFMLQNSQPRVFLTQEFLITELPEIKAQVVCLDTDWHLIAQQSEENLNQTATTANLAYVIYTSGSTGTPKGVKVTHGNLCHYAQAMGLALGITGTDVYLHTASIAFSSSVRQLMVPLASGATVTVATSEQRKDPRALFAGIKQHDVTVIDIVPSYWRNCVHTLIGLEPGTSQALLDNKLRLIVSASEPLLSDIPTQWTFGFKHGARLINMFGQTETCGIVATYPIPAQQDDRVKIVPLGRPIPNTQIYLLDSHMQPVPIGVPGELHIGGVGLAQGYLNRPELTDEKFIPNPFIQEQGARIYKTGDLARFLPNGNIEFLGRGDYQVKIRGFRIELGEIEAVLSQHPSIVQTVVIAYEHIPGDKRLVAYVVPNKHTTATISELRRFLKEKLPEYMVPSVFVLLEALPLTPSGKVNRSALPAPEQALQESEATFVAPRDDLEQKLSQIWEEVLGIQPIGIMDNFFDLGGHSLLAMQVIYRVRQAFSTEIPLGLLFETPTIASLAQAIAQSQNQGTDTSKNQAIAKRTNKESTPLSFAQQRLWFLDQLEPDSAAYHIIKGVQLQGDLNVAVLQQTLDAIVAHHEALRTNFLTDDGNPVQVISESRSVELVMIDLKDCPETERTTQVEQLLQQQAQRPFNLTKDLMLRACLVQRSPQEHILLLVMHHIASDGWSISILFEQLTTLYQAFLNGLPNPLPELPIQYADFAQWQRQWLSGEVLENQVNYWKQQLADATPVLELPTDQPRPAVQTYQGAKQSFVIPQSLSASLSALSRTEGVTLFMTLLAAFQTLLYRYTGQEDILVGSPIAGRNWSEVEGLIGFFVNTLVLRTDMSGNSSFRELLQRVRAVAMSAYAHQDLPFEKLVEELQPQRSLSYHPIFQVMFVLQNTPKQTLDLSGLTLTPFDLDNVTSMFDLTLSMKETEQGLQGFWEYNTDLFDAATITRMTGHFQTLLDGIVANPQQHISELPLLTKAERQQLLVQWNNTQADYQKDTCLHQLIEVQVEKTPDAIAIVFEDQQLTYRQLNTRANQLAHYLQSLGIGPDVLVGICVERSLEMVIGLLGILKAGGAYVPLDPGYPQERLAYMLEDSQVAVLLTQQRLMVSVPQHSAQVVLLDADWEDIAQQRQENPISGAKADNFAYVIYTSGTTGKPKGVLVNHSNVVRLFKATEAWYKFNEHDVWTLFHSYAFDFSVWELWGALLYGGRVVVVSYYVSRSPEDFYNLLRSEQVTVLNQTPSAFRQLIRVDEFSGSAKKLNLRLVIFGGEALELQSLKPWFERHGDQFPQLVNMYGITETTVHVTYRPLTVDDLNSKGSVIGSPIPDLKLYILDQNLQPVPIGVPGEMYVGGAGVTQGYLNRPELTDERFIPNRFSTNPEERLYKTGDLARYLLDGDIEYLGRIDHQVKIRGFRIEIGEIEAVLAQHPEVREVVVLAREDSPGDKRLVAYVVPNQESVFTPTELRHFLKEQLPEYMVPSAFVFLEALPLTSNGKLNRRALPAPDGSNQESEATFVAPRDDLEQKLSQIWSEVLGIQPIGVRDNFFDLGGHSLLAVRLFSQIEKNFDKKLPLATLFQSGTVEALANMLRQGQEPAVSNQVLIAAHQQDTSEAPWSSLVEIQPTGSKPPLFCIHPLGGETLCYRDLAKHLGSEQPVYGLQPIGLDGKEPPSTRIEDMASHYIQEIQKIQPNGPYFLLGWSFGGFVVYEMAQQLYSQGEKVGLLGMIDTSRPGYSKRSPFLIRVFLHFNNIFRRGPAYIWQKAVGWSNQGKYEIQQKYKRYLNATQHILDITPHLAENDEHLEVIDANVQALDKYIFQVYPGRMTLFRTSDENRYEAIGETYDPQFGWGDILTGGIDINYIPGSHLSVMEEPHVQVIAEQLKVYLENAHAINLKDYSRFQVNV